LTIPTEHRVSKTKKSKRKKAIDTAGGKTVAAERGEDEKIKNGGNCKRRKKTQCGALPGKWIKGEKNELEEEYIDRYG